MAKVLRNVASRSRSSEIGYVICPRTNIAVKSESGNEHNAILYCYMDPAVERVTAQSARVYYQDDKGKRRHHTIDLRAHRYDGYIHGLLVKPDSKAVETGLRVFTKMLAAVTRKEVANDLNYVTERDMPEHELRNAALILSCRRERRTEVDDALGKLAPTIDGDIPIAELCAALGGGMHAFRPVVRAIFYGTLNCVTDGLINPTSIVRYSGSVQPDLDADGPIFVQDARRIDGTAPKEVKRKPAKKRHSYRKS